MALVLLGVTGGIAAYKACTLARLLVRAGHDVYPLVTAGAQRFVSAETFFALARKASSDDPYPHLRRADLLVVAPLTAHTLARLAHGLADDLLTEAALAHAGPVLVAPAMNARMWANEATQTNVVTLRARGVTFVGPVAGELADGEEDGSDGGTEDILADVEELLRAARRRRARCAASVSSSPLVERASLSMRFVTWGTDRRVAWGSQLRRRRVVEVRT
jgi:phosphopantothenoylcysteine decarboxylase/phosphopantothenate--cysteine ligase